MSADWLKGVVAKLKNNMHGKVILNTKLLAILMKCSSIKPVRRKIMPNINRVRIGAVTFKANRNCSNILVMYVK